MAGSQPIFQSRHRDTRFAAIDMRPFSVLNGVNQPVQGDFIAGTPVTGPEAGTNQVRKGSLNRVVEFEGETYWWHGDIVRVHVPGSGWTRGAAPAGGRGIDTPSSDVEYSWVNLGLFPILDKDGNQELVVLYCDAATTARIGLRRKQSKITSDGSWGSEEIIDFSSDILNTNAPLRSAYNYYAREGNDLYMQWVDSLALRPGYAKIDLQNGVGLELGRGPNLTTISSGVQVNYEETPHVFCGYSGIMWYMYRLGGFGLSLTSNRPNSPGQRPSSWVLERVDGVFPQNELVIISGLAPDGVTAPSIGDSRDWATGRSEMFVDPDEGKMYGMTFIRGSGNQSGYAIWQFDYDAQSNKLINEGDVGWVTLPTALRMKNSTSQTSDVRSRWKAYNLVDSSGVSTVILEYISTGVQANPANFYQWNGPTQQMTALGQGGDSSWSRPNIKIGGGQRVWSPRQPYNFAFRVSDSGAPVGTVNLYTRVFGNGEDVKVRWLYTDANQGMVKQAIVQNPSSGVLSGSQVQVSGIIAGGGEFKVEWKLQDQGFEFGDLYDIHPVADND